MINIKNAISFFLIFTSVIIKAQISYSETPERPIKNTYHGVEIIDNYQWLENTETVEVKDWVDEQNKLSERYLNKLERRTSSISMMNRFMFNNMDYENIKEIRRNDNLYFKIMYSGQNIAPSIYYSKGSHESFEKLISPNSISKKDQILFSGLIPSRDDRFLAYQYSRNGSDWKEIKIVQIKKRRYFKETLKHTISSEIYWYGQGFFYKMYPKDSTNGKRIFPKIMYHILDTEQSEDKIIFDVKDENETLRIYGTSKQNLYVVKKSNLKNNKFHYYYLDSESNDLEFHPMFENITYNINIISYKLDKVIALTTINNKKFIISFPITNPKKWKILSPSYSEAVLTDFEIMEDKIVTSFQSQETSIISVTNYDGEILGETTTPEGLSVSGLRYSSEFKTLYFKLSSYTVPPVTCELNLEDYSYKYLGKVNVGFDAQNYKFMRKTFKSHDGVDVPIFIVYKDSIKNNGEMPFLLNTYGGYGTIAKPSYNPGIIYFIENGGAFAYVHVRGGGELGHEWSESGKNLNKRNSILDFIKGAEYLIDVGYTKPKNIAITGTSHGGLIVAAAIMGKPEIFGAAVIDVGVLDMLKFENSSVGSTYTNISEFGSIKNEVEFKNLLSYSPFHNIDYSINYPSMLILTGSDDTRVPPYHSYKFAGKLQNNPNQTSPILLWSQDKTGHFGANEYRSKLDENAYVYSFLFHELNKK